MVDLFKGILNFIMLCLVLWGVFLGCVCSGFVNGAYNSFKDGQEMNELRKEYLPPEKSYYEEHWPDSETAKIDAKIRKRKEQEFRAKQERRKRLREQEVQPQEEVQNSKTEILLPPAPENIEQNAADDHNIEVSSD